MCFLAFCYLMVRNQLAISSLHQHLQNSSTLLLLLLLNQIRDLICAPALAAQPATLHQHLLSPSRTRDLISPPLLVRNQNSRTHLSTTFCEKPTVVAVLQYCSLSAHTVNVESIQNCVNYNNISGREQRVWKSERRNSKGPVWLIPPTKISAVLGMEFKCVHCGSKVKSLFIQYSPGNIRLMKCENCKQVADEYIECEVMILLIDLILQKQKAYSHLLFNTRDNVDFEGLLWKLGVVCLLLDACKILLLKECKEDWWFSRSFELSGLACGKALIYVILLNFVFISVLLLATRILLTSLTGITSFKDVLLAIVISSYFKIFLVATMIWEFPPSVPFVIDILVLSSNAVALKVVSQSTTARCILVCFSAHAAKFLANRRLR